MNCSHEPLQNNSNEGLRECLRKLDQKFYEEQLRKAGKILNLTSAKRPRQCEHVKSNGEFCGSPALRGRSYCYFHLTHIGRRLRAERSQARVQPDSPKSGAVRLELPPLEDRNSIQIALMQVVDALLDNRIDTKRAGLLLCALQTASSNLARGAGFEQASATAVASRYEDFEKDFELGDDVPELRKAEAEEVKLDDEHAAAAREQQVLEACTMLEEVQKEAEEAERIAALDDGSDIFECDPPLKFMCRIKGPLAGAAASDEAQQQPWEREAGSQRLELVRNPGLGPTGSPAQFVANRRSVGRDEVLGRDDKFSAAQAPQCNEQESELAA